MSNYPLLTQIEVRQIANGVLLTIDLRNIDCFYSYAHTVGPLHYQTEEDALDSVPRLTREGKEAMAKRELARQERAAEAERAKTEAQS